MRYTLQAYSIWEYGQRVDDEGRPHQEDSLFPAHGAATASDRLFILCDGMGGHDAGEVASATVCAALSNAILAAQDTASTFSDDILRQGLAAAYDALDAHADSSQQKTMGTTLALLALHSGGATIAHIGDSRVYHIRPGKNAATTTILFRTADHSLVQQLVRIGEMTDEEARHSRRKNIITRAMQPLVAPRPQADIYHTADILPGDYFYLCCDGMLENMSDEQLCHYFSAEAGSDEEKVLALTAATSENRDNHSALIIHITAVEGAAAATPSSPSTKKQQRNALYFVPVLLSLLVVIAVGLCLVPKEKVTAPPAEEQRHSTEGEIRKPPRQHTPAHVIVPVANTMPTTVGAAEEVAADEVAADEAAATDTTPLSPSPTVAEKVAPLTQSADTTASTAPATEQPDTITNQEQTNNNNAV